jgi:hypothetical protein
MGLKEASRQFKSDGGVVGMGMFLNGLLEARAWRVNAYYYG